MSTDDNFRWVNAQPTHVAGPISAAIRAITPEIAPGARVLDLGCGNGHMSETLHSWGCNVVGVDPSPSGVALASARPGIRITQGEARPDLIDLLGEAPFDLVVSTEVVEHVFDCHAWTKCAFNALRPGGVLVCSTPYHGYLKNLALAVMGKWDFHHHPLQTGGHIKFFSPATLSQLLTQAGFTSVQWRGAGRFPGMWMSMVMRATRPG